MNHERIWERCDNWTVIVSWAPYKLTRTLSVTEAAIQPLAYRVFHLSKPGYYYYCYYYYLFIFSCTLTEDSEDNCLCVRVCKGSITFNGGIGWKKGRLCGHSPWKKQPGEGRLQQSAPLAGARVSRWVTTCTTRASKHDVRYDVTLCFGVIGEDVFLHTTVENWVMNQGSGTNT